MWHDRVGLSVIQLFRRTTPAFSHGAAGNPHIDDVISRRPDWVKRQISNEEALVVAAEIEKCGATKALEIGCASGFSAAVIYAQLRQNGPEACELLGYDLSQRCYFDGRRKTGGALWEIHGRSARVKFKTGITSADIKAPIWHAGSEEGFARFAFIDANHRAPWAAFDLLSLARFLSPDAVIALHDVEMVFRPKFRDCNGPRDLYRCWRGEKWRYKSAPNLGFLRRGDNATVAISVASALMCDWDEEIATRLLDKFRALAAFYGEESREMVETAIASQRGVVRMEMDGRLR